MEYIMPEVYESFVGILIIYFIDKAEYTSAKITSLLRRGEQSGTSPCSLIQSRSRSNCDYGMLFG